MKPNPKMIILAREVRGVTQSQLTKKAKTITQGNLSRMEKGTLPISENALLEISNILDFPKSFFYQESVKTPINDFYYRKRVTIPKKKLLKLESKMDIIRIGLDNLLSDIELPSLNIPNFEDEWDISPEEAARKLRNFLRIPRGPVLDFITLLESNGVIVFFVDSESDKFDGITLFTDKRNVILFLNSNLPNDRKRFTLAHELAHIALHLRNPLSEKTIDVKEKEADRFAAEFLMPELDIRNDLTRLTLSNLGTLKSHWQVSMRALVYRAKAINAITPRRAKNLYIELSKLGYVKKEPGIVKLDKPFIVNDSIKLLRTELNYSYSELASNLSLSLSDFMDFFLGIKENVINLKLRGGQDKLKSLNFLNH